MATIMKTKMIDKITSNFYQEPPHHQQRYGLQISQRDHSSSLCKYCLTIDNAGGKKIWPHRTNYEGHHIHHTHGGNAMGGPNGTGHETNHFNKCNSII